MRILMQNLNFKYAFARQYMKWAHQLENKIWVRKEICAKYENAKCLLISNYAYKYEHERLDEKWIFWDVDHFKQNRARA
jgi:hypothetical protein